MNTQKKNRKVFGIKNLTGTMICMFKEMNTYTFGKIMKIVRKIDIKLATAKNRINYLVSEPNYRATK